MDRISLLGLTLGILAIVLGQLFEGGSVGSLIQPTAFFIVIGGTLGAVMLQSSTRTFLLGVRMAKWIFWPPRQRPAELIRQMVQWSHVARKEGLLALEAQIPNLADPFVRRGLQLLVDGAEPEGLREVMHVEINSYEAQMRLGARVWESAGGYAPTIGILGAVMGLIHVMENLSDPSRLGSGIAVAFVATIYGVGFANLVFLPIAKKLMAIVHQMALIREMYVDGLVGIANGDNPRMIESRLQGYFT